MPIVNLGSIKNAPRYTQFLQVPVTWNSSTEKINIDFQFKTNRTYLVFVRSSVGTVTIENNDVSVNPTEVLTNQQDGYYVSGGDVFEALIGVSFSFGLTIPVISGKSHGIEVRKTKSAGVASVFDVGIFEL